MVYVLPLSSPALAPSVAGNKAARLAELRRAGFPVPVGFCLTTEAYWSFVQGTGLDALIKAELTRVVVQDLAAGEHVSAVIQEAMKASPVPGDIRIPMEQAYGELGRGAVAVRSSGTQEDMAAASFAGQYDTYLGVHEVADILDRVRGCWSSLYNPQAIRYRAERGLDPMKASMAVVVQRMLDPAISGVTFTINPITGDPDEIYVTATYGLGEPLGSGRVTPDTMVFRGRDLALAYAEVGEKAVVRRLAPTGGLVDVTTPADGSHALSITEELGRRVARLADRLAEHFGAAQEMEWAVQNGRIFVLQCRPMALSPRNEPTWDSPIEGAHWRRGRRVGEWLSAPVSPLFATSLLPALVAGRERYGAGHLGWDQPGTFTMLEPWFCIVNGYLYYREDRDPATLDWVGGTPLVQDDPVPSPTADSDRPWEDASARIDAAVSRAGERLWLQAWRRKHWPAYRRRLQRLRRFDPRSASAAGCLAFLEEGYRDAAEWWYLFARIGYGHEHAFRLFYDRYVPDPGRPPSSIFTAGYDNRGLKRQRQLQSFVQQIDSDPALRQIFLNEDPQAVLRRLASDSRGVGLLGMLESYLAAHGHQIFSLDFSVPTLGEQPEVAVAALQTYLRQRPESPAGVLASLQRQRRLAERYAWRRLRTHPEQWRTFQLLLKWIQECSAVREDAMYDFQRVWPLMRGALRELGARLAGVGALDHPDDVFFLEQSELMAAARCLDQGAPRDGPSFRVEVGQRRTEWERQSRLAPPDWIPPPRAGGPAPRGRGLVEDEGGRRLVGQGASPGQARGPARVIRAPAEFGRFRQGDILVAVATTPAWSVLFPLATAIVTEVGGVPSHASVVAREYGIPAVFGTSTATQVIRDGQIVTVDGSSGIVWLSIASAPSPFAGEGWHGRSEG